MDHYFKITPDFTFDDQCLLSEPLGNDGRELHPTHITQPRPISPQAASHADIISPGALLGLNLTAGCFPIVRKDISEQVSKFCGGELQRLKINISGDENFELWNVLKCVDCIDEERSDFSRWTADDGILEKIGDYRFNVLKIKHAAAQAHHLFRVLHCESVLVCSSAIKEIIECFKGHGKKFVNLTA
jgi:hypothetical protein